MTADKTLTTKEFTEKWIDKISEDENHILHFDNQAKCLSDLNALLRAEIEEHDKKRAKDYSDTEADGYVFCGKCGAMKTI
jgi:hypothetical protein